MMTRKNFWQVTAVAAVLSLSAAALVGCSSQPTDPEDIVKSYLEAVRDGNADRAVELINPGTPKTERVLLTSDAINDDVEIENIVVLSSEGAEYDSDEVFTPSHREVIAKYDLDGETVNVTFSADKTSDGWMVEGGYAYVNIPASKYAKDFTVNGVSVKKALKETSSLPVFPGVYDVALKENSLVKMKTTTFSTANGESYFEITPTKAVLDQLDTVTSKFIEECFAAGVDTRDESCPNWQYINKDSVADVEWTLLTAPKFNLAYSDGEFYVGTSTEIEAKVSYSYMSDSWYGGGTQYVTDSIQSMRPFKAKVTEGKITFEKPESTRTSDYGVSANELAFY